jgi:hypothetical protein
LNTGWVKVPVEFPALAVAAQVKSKWSGVYGIRTRDLLNAIEALYQLS